MIAVPEFPLVNCKKNCCVRLLISWVPCLADSVSTYWFCTISGKALLTMKHYPQWNGVGKLHFKEVFEERAVVLFQHKNSVSKVWFFFFFFLWNDTISLQTLGRSRSETLLWQMRLLLLSSIWLRSGDLIISSLSVRTTLKQSVTEWATQ